MRIILSLIFILFSWNNSLADPLLRPWTHHNQEQYVAGVTKNSHSGKHSAYLKSRDVEKVEKGQLWQAIKPPLEWLGERVRMTGYLKTVGVQKSAGLFMEAYTYGNWHDHDYMKKRSIRGDTDWRKYEIVMDIAPDTNLIGFGVWIYGRGEVLIDEFKFEIVDYRVETTGKSNLREYGEPVNLDFETSQKSIIK